MHAKRTDRAIVSRQCFSVLYYTFAKKRILGSRRDSRAWLSPKATTRVMLCFPQALRRLALGTAGAALS